MFLNNTLLAQKQFIKVTHSNILLTCLSVECCFNFSLKFCTEDWRDWPLRKDFPSSSKKSSMGLKCGLCRGQSTCENYVSDTKWASWILELSSWNMPVHQGRRSPLTEFRILRSSDYFFLHTLYPVPWSYLPTLLCSKVILKVGSFWAGSLQNK